MLGVRKLVTLENSQGPWPKLIFVAGQLKGLLITEEKTRRHSILKWHMLSEALDGAKSCASTLSLALLRNSVDGSKVIDVQWPPRAKQWLISSKSVSGYPERKPVPDR